MEVGKRDANFFTATTILHPFEAYFGRGAEVDDGVWVVADVGHREVVEVAVELIFGGGHEA